MEQRTCPGCEQQYRPTAKHQKWCSLRCGDRTRRRRYGDRRRDRESFRAPVAIDRPCRYCGVSFSSTDGRQYYCADDCSRTAKSLREAYRRYGMTMEQYRAMWLHQGGVCAICGMPERTQRNRLLVIDHDHTTGAVRALLCSQCNRALGLLGDDPKVIDAAAEYVRRYRDL